MIKVTVGNTPLGTILTVILHHHIVTATLLGTDIHNPSLILGSKDIDVLCTQINTIMLMVTITRSTTTEIVRLLQILSYRIAIGFLVERRYLLLPRCSSDGGTWHIDGDILAVITTDKVLRLGTFSSLQIILLKVILLDDGHHAIIISILLTGLTLRITTLTDALGPAVSVSGRQAKASAILTAVEQQELGMVLEACLW